MQSESQKVNYKKRRRRIQRLGLEMKLPEIKGTGLGPRSKGCGSKHLFRLCISVSWLVKQDEIEIATKTVVKFERNNVGK